MIPSDKTQSNPSVSELIERKDTFGLIQQIKSGTKIYSPDISSILNIFSPDEAKQVLLAAAQKNRGVFANSVVGEAILKFPKEIAHEIFLVYVQSGGLIDYHICEEICVKLDREQARDIMFELDRHSNFYLAYSAKAKNIVPELCG